MIDRAYMAWVRGLPCVLCSFKVLTRWAALHHHLGERYRVPQVSPTEAAHVGQRGIGQKCSDRETIPLCREHHQDGKDSVHKLGKRFWEQHGIDRYGLIRELQARYVNKIGRAPGVLTVTLANEEEQASFDSE